MNLSSRVLHSSMLTVSLLGNMSLSQLLLAAPAATTSSVPADLKSTSTAIKIADGTAYKIDEFNISLTPPNGWQVLPNYRGKTLVLQPVPVQETTKDYSQPTFNRNITVAVLHEPRSIDETEAQALRDKLSIDFGQAAGVKDFQIIEHRLIDYREKADGILIYTAFNLNGFAMSQMHIFVSGQKNSAMLTYTDLSDKFQKNDEAMNQAWNSMLSIELEGKAPQRFQQLIYGGAAGGLCLSAAILALILRRRAARKYYQDVDDRLYQDEPMAFDDVTTVTALSTVNIRQGSSDIVTLSDFWKPEAKGSLKGRGRTRMARHDQPETSMLTAW